MTLKNRNRAKQNAKKKVSEFRNGANIVIADVKINIRKARADVTNALDHEMAEVTADLAKRNADSQKPGIQQKAAYIRANLNASIAKAKANKRHDLAYAKADFDRAKTLANAEQLDPPK